MTDLHTAMVVPPVQGRALTTAEFELIRCYALETTGEQLELIGGVLIGEDGPPYDAGRPEHSLVMTRLTMHLVPGLLGRYRLQPAGRLDLPDGSHVMPDLAILPLQEQRGVATTAHAVVEVAASSYARDMGVKPALYARAGVDEYWVVDLVASAVHVHRVPEHSRYATVTTHRPPETPALLGIDMPLAQLPRLS
jgi:hypothetical protein